MMGASILLDGPLVCPCGKPATCLNLDPLGYRCDACKQRTSKASEFEACVTDLDYADFGRNNRELITRALRRDEMIEQPSHDWADTQFPDHAILCAMASAVYDVSYVSFDYYQAMQRAMIAFRNATR